MSVKAVAEDQITRNPWSCSSYFRLEPPQDYPDFSEFDFFSDLCGRGQWRYRIRFLTESYYQRHYGTNLRWSLELSILPAGTLCDIYHGNVYVTACMDGSQSSYTVSLANIPLGIDSYDLTAGEIGTWTGDTSVELTIKITLSDLDIERMMTIMQFNKIFLSAIQTRTELVDTKFYLYSRRISDGRVSKPRSMFACSKLLIGQSSYLDTRTLVHLLNCGPLLSASPFQCFATTTSRSLGLSISISIFLRMTLSKITITNQIVTWTVTTVRT